MHANTPPQHRNALTRKGKVEDTEEDDMDVVVSIHNNMNELTWRKILEWEKIRRCVWVKGVCGLILFALWFGVQAYLFPA